MNKNKLLPILVVVATLSSVFAIWISGWKLNGSLTAISGTHDLITETWNLNFANGNNQSKQFNLSNNDGVMSKSFYLTDGLSSTDGNCTYEKNKDVKFYITNAGPECLLTENTPCPISLQSGLNYWNITVVPNNARCPLQGIFNVTLV